MGKGRRKFTDEFKREAVKLCRQPGAVVTQIARDLGLDQTVSRRWVKLERGGVMEMNPSKPCEPKQSRNCNGYSASSSA